MNLSANENPLLDAVQGNFLEAGLLRECQPGLIIGSGQVGIQETMMIERCVCPHGTHELLQSDHLLAGTLERVGTHETSVTDQTLAVMLHPFLWSIDACYPLRPWPMNMQYRVETGRLSIAKAESEATGNIKEQDRQLQLLLSQQATAPR